jgi:hypothetical protein
MVVEGVVRVRRAACAICQRMELNFEGFRFGVVLILSAHKVTADSSYVDLTCTFH